MIRRETYTHRAEDEREHPPAEQSVSASSCDVRRNALSAGLNLLPWLLLSFVVATPFGFLAWIGLIFTCFGDSGDYWPAFLCAVPGILIWVVVFWTLLRVETDKRRDVTLEVGLAPLTRDDDTRKSVRPL